MAKHALNAFSEARPTFLFTGQLLSALVGQRIESGLPVFFGGAPFGADPAVLFHAMQRWVKRALFNPKHLGGNALDVGGDSVAVDAAAGGKRLQDKQRKRALEYVVLLPVHLFP